MADLEPLEMGGAVNGIYSQTGMTTLAIPVMPTRDGMRKQAGGSEQRRTIIPKPAKDHTYLGVMAPTKPVGGITKETRRVQRDALEQVALVNQFVKRPQKRNGENPDGVVPSSNRMLLLKGTTFRERPEVSAQDAVGTRQDGPVGAGLGAGGGKAAHGKSTAMTQLFNADMRTIDALAREFDTAGGRQTGVKRKLGASAETIGTFSQALYPSKRTLGGIKEAISNGTRLFAGLFGRRKDDATAGSRLDEKKSANQGHRLVVPPNLEGAPRAKRTRVNAPVQRTAADEREVNRDPDMQIRRTLELNAAVIRSIRRQGPQESGHRQDVLRGTQVSDALGGRRSTALAKQGAPLHDGHRVQVNRGIDVTEELTPGHAAGSAHHQRQQPGERLQVNRSVDVVDDFKTSHTAGSSHHQRQQPGERLQVNRGLDVVDDFKTGHAAGSAHHQRQQPGERMEANRSVDVVDDFKTSHAAGGAHHQRQQPGERMEANRSVDVVDDFKTGHAAGGAHHQRQQPGERLEANRGVTVEPSFQQGHSAGSAHHQRQQPGERMEANRGVSVDETLPPPNDAGGRARAGQPDGARAEALRGHAVQPTVDGGRSGTHARARAAQQDGFDHEDCRGVDVVEGLGKGATAVSGRGAAPSAPRDETLRSVDVRESMATNAETKVGRTAQPSGFRDEALRSTEVVVPAANASVGTVHARQVDGGRVEANRAEGDLTAEPAKARPALQGSRGTDVRGESTHTERAVGTTTQPLARPCASKSVRASSWTAQHGQRNVRESGFDPQFLPEF